MNDSKPQSAAFLSLTALLVLACAAALAYGIPYAQAAARAEASKLIGESSAAKPVESLANYRLAVWLDPTNQTAQLSLARAQLAAWDAAAASATLNQAGQGSEAEELRLRTDIELGRADPAAGLTALIGRQASPEAAQRLARARAGKLPLAQELYAAGLPESSSAILRDQPESFERNYLLGRLNYDRHTEPSLVAAADYLKVALAINPSNLPARQLYAVTVKDLGRTGEAAKQAALVHNLELNRP
ncbi:MAG: hypothetical protein NVSMB39_1530 [Candidatus Saccharimonadales bacterium]